jgi:hypothetical protein
LRNQAQGFQSDNVLGLDEIKHGYEVKRNWREAQAKVADELKADGSLGGNESILTKGDIQMLHTSGWEGLSKDKVKRMSDAMLTAYKKTPDYVQQVRAYSQLPEYGQMSDIKAIDERIKRELIDEGYLRTYNVDRSSNKLLPAGYQNSGNGNGTNPPPTTPINTTVSPTFAYENKPEELNKDIKLNNELLNTSYKISKTITLNNGKILKEGEKYKQGKVEQNLSHFDKNGNILTPEKFAAEINYNPNFKSTTGKTEPSEYTNFKQTYKSIANLVSKARTFIANNKNMSDEDVAKAYINMQESATEQTPFESKINIKNTDQIFNAIRPLEQAKNVKSFAYDNVSGKMVETDLDPEVSKNLKISGIVIDPTTGKASLLKQGTAGQVTKGSNTQPILYQELPTNDQNMFNGTKAAFLARKNLQNQAIVTYDDGTTETLYHVDANGLINRLSKYGNTDPSQVQRNGKQITNVDFARLQGEKTGNSYSPSTYVSKYVLSRDPRTGKIYWAGQENVPYQNMQEYETKNYTNTLTGNEGEYKDIEPIKVVQN